MNYSIQYANQMRGYECGKQFAYFIKDETKQIKGGCFGCIFYGKI